MTYIVFQNIKAKHANAVDSGLLVNAPPLLAVFGFIHNFARKYNFGELGKNPIKRFWLIHHHSQFLGEFWSKGRVSPHQRRAASYTYGAARPHSGSHDYIANTSQLSSQPIATRHIEISIVAEFKNDLNCDIQAIDVKSMRFCGGLIEKIKNITEVDDLDQAMGLIKSGFLVVDRTDLLKRSEYSSETAEVDALISHLSDPDQGASWMSAASVGYQPISELKVISGSRTDHKSCYAEPIITLTQYKSIHDDDRLNYEKASWSPSWPKDLTEGLFKLETK